MTSKQHLLAFLFTVMVCTQGRELDEDAARHSATLGGRMKRSDDFSASEVELQKLGQQVVKQEAEIVALKNQLSKFQADLHTSNTEVAFFAYRFIGRFTVTGSGILILDHMTTNVGNAFDTHSGTFTAPMAGVYAFFLTIRSYTDSSATIDIAVNGSGKSRAYVLKANTQGTAHLTVHLRKGDKVWPRNASGSNHDMCGSLYTHFSGFLVHADL